MKLGHTEEKIMNEVEDEESNIGRLYRRLLDLKNVLR